MCPTVRTGHDTGAADLERTGVAALHGLFIALVADVAFGGGHGDELVIVCGAGSDRHCNGLVCEKEEDLWWMSEKAALMKCLRKRLEEKEKRKRNNQSYL
jgi:hypothetical protein